MSQLKYSEVLDYTLILAEEIRRIIPRRTYLDLKAILDFLEYDTSFAEMLQIAEYLATMGFIKTIHGLGEIRIQITSSGILHVEELGTKTVDIFWANIESIHGEIGRNVFNPDRFMPTSNPKEKIFTLILETQNVIKKTKGQNSDYFKDLDLIRLELQKTNPDFRIVEIKLNILENIREISEQVEELRTYTIMT